MKLRSMIKKSSALFYGIFLICALFSGTAFAQQTTGTTTDTGKQADVKKEEAPSDKAKDGWMTTDYKPYISTIKDLEKLSKEYSDFLLKRSIDEYSKGFDTLEDMQSEIITA